MKLLTKLAIGQSVLRYCRSCSEVRADWRWLPGLQEWQARQRERSKGKRVLIATGTGSNWPCSSFESMLGVALALRGADVRFLLCDGVLSACQECDRQWLSETKFVRHGPAHLCDSCYRPAHAMLSPLGLPVLRYSQFLGGVDFTTSEAALEEHAVAGTLRYFGRGTLPEGEAGASILARYRQAAADTASVVRRLVVEQRPEVAVFHHGIYVPQGIVGQVLREAGVRVVNWGPAYRKHTVLFSHGDSYHHTMIDEPPSQWAEMPWSHAEEALLMDYLRSRRTGGNDWINFQEGAEQDGYAIVARLELDVSRPIIGLLTNVIWDAQLHFRQAAFPSMLEWLFASIDSFMQRPELQLVIRIHPGEVLGTVPSCQPVAAEIARRYGRLPPHIKIVGSEEKISTYALMDLCNAALVYGTKTALEIACSGLPVIVAGEAWCRGKGFTVDVSSQDEYEVALASLPFPDRLSARQITAARKYAYHFFFRRMIPVASLKSARRFGPYVVKVDRLEELKPGADPGLDSICDGILNGREFVFQG